MSDLGSGGRGAADGGRGSNGRGGRGAYTGHVEPGSPAISRLVALPGGAEVEVRKFSVGPVDNNVYLLTDRQSGRALLIDAANEADRILREIAGVEVAAIMTTHGHGDHWQALDAVADATGAPTYLHPADAPMVPRPADHGAEDGQRIAFGTAEATLIHNPGHTPGSTSILLGDRHLFTGDTLFPGGPGNTFGDPEKFRMIMQSLRERLFALPDDTWVYPGHGDDTTIGKERPFLDEWEARGW
jgi:glyoxylase-like metal-dependent hydrolase (beta-lactamase superfamily II)